MDNNNTIDIYPIGLNSPPSKLPLKPKASVGWRWIAPCH